MSPRISPCRAQLPAGDLNPLRFALNSVALSTRSFTRLLSRGGYPATSNSRQHKLPWELRIILQKRLLSLQIRSWRLHYAIDISRPRHNSMFARTRALPIPREQLPRETRAALIDLRLLPWTSVHAHLDRLYRRAVVQHKPKHLVSRRILPSFRDH